MADLLPENRLLRAAIVVAAAAGGELIEELGGLEQFAQ